VKVEKQGSRVGGHALVLEPVRHTFTTIIGLKSSPRLTNQIRHPSSFILRPSTAVVGRSVGASLSSHQLSW